MKHLNSLQRLLLESIFQAAELGNYRLNEDLPTTKKFVAYTEQFNLRPNSESSK